MGDNSKFMVVPRTETHWDILQQAQGAPSRPTKCTNRKLRVESQAASISLSQNLDYHDESRSSGLQNSAFRGPSSCHHYSACVPFFAPPKEDQVLGDHSLSIVQGKELSKVVRLDFQPLVIDSPPGTYEEIHVPDRYESKEALIFCGLSKETADLFWSLWILQGETKEIDIIDFVLGKVKERAAHFGFNPWVSEVIGEGNLWNRMRSMAPEVREKLARSIIPLGDERYKWERDWFFALKDLGFDDDIILIVLQPQFAQIHDEVMVSHWAYNYIERKWANLHSLENKIHEFWANEQKGVEIEEDTEEEKPEATVRWGQKGEMKRQEAAVRREQKAARKAQKEEEQRREAAAKREQKAARKLQKEEEQRQQTALKMEERAAKRARREEEAKQKAAFRQQKQEAQRHQPMRHTLVSSYLSPPTTPGEFLLSHNGFPPHNVIPPYNVVPPHNIFPPQSFFPPQNGLKNQQQRLEFEPAGTMTESSWTAFTHDNLMWNR